MDIEAPAGFDGAEHAHQPAAHAIVGQDIAGDGLFVDVAGVQIYHRAPGSLGLGQGSFLESLTDLFDIVIDSITTKGSAKGGRRCSL